MAGRLTFLWTRGLPAAALAAWLAASPARTQELATKIWDIKLGTPVAALPLDQFVDSLAYRRRSAKENDPLFKFEVNRSIAQKNFRQMS